MVTTAGKQQLLRSSLVQLLALILCDMLTAVCRPWRAPILAKAHHHQRAGLRSRGRDILGKPVVLQVDLPMAARQKRRHVPRIQGRGQGEVLGLNARAASGSFFSGTRSDRCPDDADSISARDTHTIPHQMPDIRLQAIPKQPPISISLLPLRGSPYGKG